MVSNINRFSLADLKDLIAQHRTLCAEQGVASTVVAQMQDGELTHVQLTFRTEWVKSDSGAEFIDSSD